MHIHSHTRAYVYINTHVPIFLRTNHNHIYNHYHLQYLVILSKIYIMHHASYDYIQYYAYIYIIYITGAPWLQFYTFFCSSVAACYHFSHPDFITTKALILGTSELHQTLKDPWCILIISWRFRTREGEYPIGDIFLWRSKKWNDGWGVEDVWVI